jgi:non-canonical (house-cleaning) NTP pyrophosphatase
MEDVIDTAWRQYQRGETDVDCGRGGVFGNPRHEIYLNEQGRKVAQRMQRIVDSYNYDESNGMVDYFNTGFYAYPKVKLS